MLTRFTKFIITAIVALFAALMASAETNFKINWDDNNKIIVESKLDYFGVDKTNSTFSIEKILSQEKIDKQNEEKINDIDYFKIAIISFIKALELYVLLILSIIFVFGLIGIIMLLITKLIANKTKKC